MSKDGNMIRIAECQVLDNTGHHLILIIGSKYLDILQNEANIVIINALATQKKFIQLEIDHLAKIIDGEKEIV